MESVTCNLYKKREKWGQSESQSKNKAHDPVGRGKKAFGAQTPGARDGGPTSPGKKGEGNNVVAVIPSSWPQKARVTLGPLINWGKKQERGGQSRKSG